MPSLFFSGVIQQRRTGRLWTDRRGFVNWVHTPVYVINFLFARDSGTIPRVPLIGRRLLAHYRISASIGAGGVMPAGLVHLAALRVIGIVLAPVRRNLPGREADAVSKRICRLLCDVGSAIITGALLVAVPCAAQQLTNDKLSLTVEAEP